MTDLCDIQSDISQIYEEESLPYIQLADSLTFDQAESYLPSIQAAYKSYFASMQSNITMMRPPVVQGVELRTDGVNVLSRIYYQILASTSQPSNAFNYDISYTSFRITSNNLSTVIVQWLPQVSIEEKLMANQKDSLTSCLLSYWNSSII